jgi:uncharacterized protein involved in outer membrane biogenesis
MLMKKIIVRLIIALVVVVILAVLGVGLFLDKAIKTAVETIGPKVIKVDVKVQSVSLSLLSGSGTIRGLMLGNPTGFKTPYAINVGEASLALTPRSLLSDKVIVKSIKVQGPEITYETNLKDNNLSKIVANMQGAAGGGQKEPAQPKEAKPAKKLEVDEFIITGGKIHVSVTALNGGTATVPLPAIHLQDLGTGPDGITPEELAIKVMEKIEQGTVKAAAAAVTDIAKGALYIAKDPRNAGSNAVQSVTKGLGNLLKK